MRISRELEVSLTLAVNEARRRRHEFLCVEHVLYALLHDEDVAEVVRHCGGDVAVLKRELEQFFDEKLERLPERGEGMPHQTLAFQRVIQRAAAHVQSAGKEEILGRNVLVAIFREPDSHAAHLLERQGVTRLDVVSYISHGVSKIAEEPAETRTASAGSGEEEEEESDDQGAPRSKKDPLTLFAVGGLCRHPAQIQRRNQLIQHHTFHGWGQIERLDLGGDGHDKKRHGRQQVSDYATRFLKPLATAL